MVGRYGWMLAAPAAFISAPAVLGAEAVPPPLSAYGELPSVEAMSISPDGTGHAAVARIKGTRQVILMDAKHRPKRMLPIGDMKLWGVNWASAQIAIVTTSATQGLGMEFIQDKVELYGAIRLTLDGAEPEMIFARDSSMARAIWGTYGFRTVGDKPMGYFGGVELKRTADQRGYEFDHGRPALFQVDLESGRKRRVGNAPGEGIDREWLVDGAGGIGATLDLSVSSGAWKIKNQGGKTIASGKNIHGRIGFVAFGKDGTSVIYHERATAEDPTRWFEVSLEGGQAQEILTDFEIERAFVDPRNNRLLGYLPAGTSAKPVLYDPERQAQIAQVYRAFPASDLNIVQWTPDFSKFLIHTSGNENPGTWYIVDMLTKRADPVGDDYPAIASEAVGAISTVTYKAGDGLELDGILTLPPGRKPDNLPLVVFPHGGPHAHDEPRFDWWAQAFASRGYAVFQPNFRGSTNRDEAFVRAGYGQWGRKMQTDISDGVTELARQGVIDPKRACIVGASYGGYAALAGVTLQQGLYRCAVSVAGVSDLSDLMWTDYRESGNSKVLKRNRTETLGHPSTFAEVSPRKHAVRADAPILLIHGKDDTVVPFKQSNAMADALRSASKPHEMVILKEEDHWLSRSTTRTQMLEASVAFVQKHNPAD